MFRQAPSHFSIGVVRAAQSPPTSDQYAPSLSLEGLPSICSNQFLFSICPSLNSRNVSFLVLLLPCPHMFQARHRSFSFPLGSPSLGAGYGAFRPPRHLNSHRDSLFPPPSATFTLDCASQISSSQRCNRLACSAWTSRLSATGDFL